MKDKFVKITEKTKHNPDCYVGLVTEYSEDDGVQDLIAIVADMDDFSSIEVEHFNSVNWVISEISSNLVYEVFNRVLRIAEKKAKDKEEEMQVLVGKHNRYRKYMIGVLGDE